MFFETYCFKHDVGNRYSAANRRMSLGKTIMEVNSRAGRCSWPAPNQAPPLYRKVLPL